MRFALLTCVAIVALVGAMPIDNALHDLQKADLAAEDVAKDARKIGGMVRKEAKDINADNNEDGTYPVGDMMTKLNNMPEVDKLGASFEKMKNALLTKHPNAAAAHPGLKMVADRMIKIGKKTHNLLDDVDKQGDKILADVKKHPAGLDELAAGELRSETPTWLKQEEHALRKSGREFASIAKSEHRVAKKAEAYVERAKNGEDTVKEDKPEETAADTVSPSEADIDAVLDTKSSAKADDAPGKPREEMADSHFEAPTWDNNDDQGAKTAPPGVAP